MKFTTPFLATGIGSFPHTGEKEVFDLILDHFSDIPFWPQFPRRTFFEGMVVQYSQGFPCLRWVETEQKAWVDPSGGGEKEVENFYESAEKGELEPFRMTDDFAKGLGILKELTAPKYRSRMKYIKGQITGPITFGLSLADRERRPIFYDPTLRDILLKHLSLKARWMEKRFNDLLPGIRTIISFDEPSLSSYGSAFSSLNREEVIASLNECLSAVRGLKGVHCCGNTDWGLLFDTALDILSFDAYGYLETLALYPKELSAFLERGGILAWGIVPTDEAITNEDAEGLVRRFKKGMETLSKRGIDPLLLQRAIITPSCGTASLSVPLAEQVHRITAEVSKRLQEEVK